MRVAAISDLHIGPRAETDAFRHDQDAFLGWLDALESRFDRVVLLGDIYQCDHGWWPSQTSQLDQLEAARARVSRITERFAEAQYTLVHGNHDEVSQALGAVETVLLGAPGAQVLFVHGHQHDPMLVHAKPLSNAATWFSGRVRAAGLVGWSEAMEEQDVQVKARRFSVPDGPYARGASGRLQQTGARWIVMGHTHVPLRQVLPEGLMLNTGTCSRGRRMGAWIDTDTGEGGHL